MEVPQIEKKIGISLYSTDIEGTGGWLRQEVEDFTVREITNREEGKEGKYLILELRKRDWDTHHLTRTLAKVLQISQKRIGVAGTKDKRAFTTQKISIFDIDASEVENIHLKDIELKVLGRSRKSIELGDLWGNDFVIKIRDIASPAEETKKLLEKTTNEILAQNGKRDGRAGAFEIAEAPLEEGFIGEHGKRRGATALVGRGYARGVEIRREHPFAGRSLLDFRDDGGRARAQGRAKIAARGETRFGLGLPLVEPWDAAGKLFALPGDNSGQDVWNGAGQG